MNVLLYMAEAILVAYVMRRLSLRLKIPTVSAYVVGGAILGGSLFFWHPGGRSFSEQWLFTRDVLAEMTVITQIALGIIALSIGTELELKMLRSLGRSVVVITLFGALIPFVCVAISLWLFQGDIALGLILGAVASATAPAATVAVIQQYKARGPLTSTIIAVVGLDDAVSFMIFAFVLAVVKGMLGGGPLDVIHGLLVPMKEILVSLAVGGAAGFGAAQLLMTAKDQENSIFILLLLIFTVSGVAVALEASELLANMAAGAVIVNVHPFLKKRIRLSFSSFTPIVYALFFILGGAHLDLSRIGSIWLASIIYFTFRAAGKIAGATFGAHISGSLPVVRKWVGISMLPQVGAAVALALVVETQFAGGEFGAQGIALARTVFNILLVTTFFTEFIGPYLTRMAVVRGGEAREI